MNYYSVPFSSKNVFKRSLITMEERIIYIPKLQYECYFLGNSWKIVYVNTIKSIDTSSFIGSPFFVIFENIEVVSKQLKMLTNKYGKLLSEIFPIELILKDMVDHKQSYWLNLGVDFILEMNYLNESIARILIETKNNTDFTQELRHKIRKIILLNNYEY